MYTDMHVALLFNSGDSKFQGTYGDPIRDAILSTNILQRCGRQLKVKVGDVLLASNAHSSKQSLVHLAKLTFYSCRWRHLLGHKLRSTYLRSTVYTWTIQNIDVATALRLHKSLLSDSAYLGMHEIDLSIPIHLVLYRNSLIGIYRIQGRRCHLYDSMGDVDARDKGEARALRKLGFTVVTWEDRGAHGTIFDNFDTPQHFAKVGALRRVIARSRGLDRADEAILLLEDLSPRLLVTLGTAARTALDALDEEELAQAALSARRYLEQLADALFPPRPGLINGHPVSKAKYQNRLWAFISTSIRLHARGRATRINRLGALVDDAIVAVNAGLHGNSTANRIRQVFADLADLTVELLNLDPSKTRQPYAAFLPNMSEFLRGSRRRRRFHTK
ncbi:MAG: hypothetical protein JSR73_14105 [Proteobacteria bacterium]|nr:hypothetical protein [Pseudomonadota bacterium]